MSAGGMGAARAVAQRVAAISVAALEAPVAGAVKAVTKVEALREAMAAAAAGEMWETLAAQLEEEAKVEAASAAVASAVAVVITGRAAAAKVAVAKVEAAVVEAAKAVAATAAVECSGMESLRTDTRRVQTPSRSARPTPSLTRRSHHPASRNLRPTVCPPDSQAGTAPAGAVQRVAQAVVMVVVRAAGAMVKVRVAEMRAAG